MSSPFFNPSFAFSSHLDPDSSPLGELSWSPSLAVVAVSFSGLFTVIVLMLACLCCKKGAIGFKEFENADGEEYAAGRSAQGSPAAAVGGPDVYVLPLAEVSLPMAKQPGRSVQLLKSTELGRHSLLYLKEIGHGWFGKVFLGEVNSGVSSTQVVVKELQVSASVQEQVQFLEEVQPHRALQHSNLLQCLAQCAEVTPYLLVMEFCPLGDLKGYLQSCRASESMAPDALTLQRMACEVACGLLHLHRHNYVHSDLALRNCLLTADLTAKIGDYGLSHSKYREDYFVTADQLWVPLRWIAPELVDEVHGNLLVVDQTKASNVWSLGVTIWELFELGVQPYPHHSDRQVLAYAVREQQLKLPKPQLQLTLSDRWYEVMQFCWLQPEQRPTAEEVHLLLAYLCAKGATEAEEEFERRWRSLRPVGGSAGPGPALGSASGELAAAASNSSFPLLEQFAGEGFHADGDDVLTVTETSRGLNFEYKWEAGRGAADTFAPGAARLRELCAPDGAPGVVPVLSAHSPSLGSEYFIRLEEAAPAAGHDPDCAGCVPGPRTAQDSDSDSGADASLAMEPLLGPAPAAASWGPCDPRSHARAAPCRPSSPSQGGPAARHADWGAAAFCPPFLEDPCVSRGAGAARLSPGLEEEEAGAAEARRAQRGHWSSNVSANNNSGSRGPEAWDPGLADSCPSPKPSPRASPEQEDPREPLLGPQAAPRSPGPGRCLGLPHLWPLRGQATEPWPEVAWLGADGQQAHLAEPQLAQEAEGSGGPQLLVPSVPSPSQEGAPLPSEEAGAPDALPGSPTPAAGCQTPDSSCSPPELEAASSDDKEAAARATEAVPPNLREKPATMLAGQPQDPMDSLALPCAVGEGGCEPSSPLAAGPPGGQPRALDSGYDTENYESPEFVLREAQEAGQELGSPGLEPETQLAAPRGALSEKNPYRDSAYFSDLDAEPDPPSAPGKQQVHSPGPERGLGSPQEAAQGTGSAEVWLPALPAVAPGPGSPQAPGPASSLGLVLLPGTSLKAGGSSLEPPGSPQERTVDALCLASPGRPPATPGPHLPEEEEEDSEDSEESDEELRCYSVQEPGEESEEEAAVPVVVAESQSVRSLRGLLKGPGLLSRALRDGLEHKKKAVSFFDDVTVYLFDQESPARDPAEPPPCAKEQPPTFLAGSPGAPGRPWPAEGSPAAKGEQGGAFEREDFPLMPAKATLAPALDPAAPTPATPPTPASRFTVLPTPASRFSITHVADADAQAVGGPAASATDA
ncbi:serine/threonine-protein kinase LMTK1 [Ochotona curzoniae]|uniref:serine/threonine-protein kinase LMTK1 n=1 Tax=Ochotona curzoniae TaxID=130825 RepID=UPI001B34AAEC|nr:serine/threonine-protein kinase LMTK1 [Ochotona curzoniae]